MSFFSWLRGEETGTPRPVGWNPEKETPVMHLSICTGEKTLGFRNKETNKLERAVFINSDEDLKLFCKQYGISEDMIEKEW